MPFDPAKPANNSPLSSEEMRDQLNALKEEIDAHPTVSELGEAIGGAVAGSSANTNAVSTLGFTVSDPPTQSEVQQLLEKLNELINAARR
jgi:hypothetical protein